jgi:hypothetical protein
LAADYKLEPAGSPPSEVSPALASLLQKEGHKIVAPSGSAFAEVWFCSAAPSGTKSTEQGVSFTAIPHGALMGVIRFPAKGEDRRGQSIQPGVYTLRYSLHPDNGDHLGVAPQRDFLVMVPAAEDKDAKPVSKFEDLVAMSKKASGTPHPAVLSLQPPPEGAKFPSITGEKDRAINAKVGDLPISLIVVGRAES